ncbi:PepSY domain-containing protein [Lactococcus kimchii]|uniref:PepSY domain-containing protein n=1 Tax=Lactococcus sp. S-13 TaxID=2507158 RepID=UPI001680043F|nr:PepSY domain-containing protein [Lactococcus sp. S-13]
MKIIKALVLVALGVMLGWAGGYMTAHSWDLLSVLGVHESRINRVEADGERQTTSQERTMSLAEAREIAENDLRERGIEATFTRDADLDSDGGQRVWELEYHWKNQVIEYQIDAQTGQIIKFERDLND